MSIVLSDCDVGDYYHVARLAIMTHRPSVYAAGYVDRHGESQRRLMKTRRACLSTSERPSDEKIAELLEAETWMLAGGAVELGFADAGV